MSLLVLWCSTVLLAAIVVTWRWIRWRALPHLWYGLFGILSIIVSAIITGDALMEAHTRIMLTVHARPDLTLLYLIFHYVLVVVMSGGLNIRSLTDHYPSMVWPALFLYSSYIYFHNFFNFEQGVIYPFLYLLALGLVFFLPRRSILLSFTDLPRSLVISLTIFLLLGLVSTVASLSPGESLTQYTQVFCFALLPFLISGDIPNAQSWRSLAMWCILLNGVLLFILAVIKVGLLIWKLDFATAIQYRLFIADIGPNWLSYSLVILLPLCIVNVLIAATNKRKALWGFIVLGCLLTLAYTQSNLGYSGWMGLTLSGGAFALLLLGPVLRRLWHQHPYVSMVSIVLVLGLIILFAWSGIRVARQINSYSLYTRLYDWRVTLSQITSNPWLGSGLNVRHAAAHYSQEITWEYFITRFQALLPYYELSSAVQKRQLITHTHSLFLELAAGAGIPALLAFLWFLGELLIYGISMFRQSVGHARLLMAGCISGIVASLGWGMIDVMEYSPPFFTTPTWILIGLVLAAPRAFGSQIANDKYTEVRQPCAKHYILRNVFYALCLVFAIVVIILPVFANIHYKAAYTAYQEHRWTTSIEELALASQWEPLNTKYHQLRAEALINLGRYQDAIAVYEHAVQLKRDFSPYHSQLGWLYWLQGDLEQATAHFLKAVEVDPHEAWHDGLYTDLALAYVAQGRIAEALPLLKEAIELDPNTALKSRLDWISVQQADGTFDVILDPAFLLPTNGDGEIGPLQERILAHLGRADYTPRLFTYAHNTLSHDYSTVSMNRILDAIEADYAVAQAANSKAASRLLATVAEAARLSGLHTRAELAYLNYQSTFPTSEYGFRELGDFYRELGRLEEAQVMLEHSVRVNPDDIESWLILSEVYLSREMYSQTATSLDTCYRLSPLYARIYELRAQLYQQQGNLTQAVTETQKSLVITESFSDHMILADLYRQLDQPERSTYQCLQATSLLMRIWPRPLDPRLRQIGKCLAVDANSWALDSKLTNDVPTAVIWHILTGHVYRERGQLNQAMTAYKAAAAARTDESGPHYFLGETYQALGEWELAEAQYRLAVQLDPLESLPLQALGQMQWSQDKREAALASFRMAVEATPGWGQTHMGLGNALLALGKRGEASAQYQLAQIADGDVYEGAVYDFTARLAEAELQAPGADYIRGEYFTIDDERKRVLFVHPDSRVKFTIDLAGQRNLTGLELTFAIAMSPESWTQEGDGVTFASYVVSEQSSRQVFSTYINPKHNQADQRWIPFTIDLSAYIGQKVSIAFETNCGPAGDCRYDWAGWGMPLLQVK